MEPLRAAVSSLMARLTRHGVRDFGGERAAPLCDEVGDRPDTGAIMYPRRPDVMAPPGGANVLNAPASNGPYSRPGTRWSRPCSPPLLDRGGCWPVLAVVEHRDGTSRGSSATTDVPAKQVLGGLTWSQAPPGRITRGRVPKFVKYKAAAWRPAWGIDDRPRTRHPQTGCSPFISGTIGRTLLGIICFPARPLRRRFRRDR